MGESLDIETGAREKGDTAQPADATTTGNPDGLPSSQPELQLGLQPVEANPGSVFDRSETVALPFPTNEGAAPDDVTVIGLDGESRSVGETIKLAMH